MRKNVGVEVQMEWSIYSKCAITRQASLYRGEQLAEVCHAGRNDLKPNKYIAAFQQRYFDLEVLCLAS